MNQMLSVSDNGGLYLDVRAENPTLSSRLSSSAQFFFLIDKYCTLFDPVIAPQVNRIILTAFLVTGDRVLSTSAESDRAEQSTA